MTALTALEEAIAAGQEQDRLHNAIEGARRRTLGGRKTIVKCECYNKEDANHLRRCVREDEKPFVFFSWFTWENARSRR